MPSGRKVVLLTGGSRGLGLELARVLARRGARLALLARDDEELAGARDEVRGLDAEVETFACDVRFQDQVQRTVREVLERFGRVDVLINNAGVIQVGPEETMRVSDYQEAMDTHFSARCSWCRPCCRTCAAARGPHRQHRQRRREGAHPPPAAVRGQQVRPGGWSEGLHAELGETASSSPPSARA